MSSTGFIRRSAGMRATSSIRKSSTSESRSKGVWEVRDGEQTYIFSTCMMVGGIAILLFGSGCSAIKAYWEWSSYWMSVSEDRIYPKRPKFTVHPGYVNGFPEIILPAVYYSNQSYTNQSGDLQICYDFIRLWPSGHCYGRYIRERIPTLEDVESFKQACLGFYEINENEFSMDLYFLDYYQRVWGQIDHEKIVISNAEQRYNGPIYKMQDNIVYFRLPLARMQRQPDWSPTGMLHQAFSGARTANTTDDPKTSD